MNIAINGICGRMGQAILRIMLERGHTLGAAFDHESATGFGGKVRNLINNNEIDIKVEKINENSLQNIDGVIDFTVPGATLEVLKTCNNSKVPVVIGTTGFTDEEKIKINEASKSIPILFSPNMSVGVNLLFKLTELASDVLKSDFDVEIFEAHHRFKKDAPSGTARKLIEIIKENIPSISDEKHGREGIIGERKDNELGVLTMRGGDIVGEHTVFFAGTGERLELTHRATNRDIFAKGAIIGIEFLYDKKASLYNMYDVLGF